MEEEKRQRGEKERNGAERGEGMERSGGSQWRGWEGGREEAMSTLTHRPVPDLVLGVRTSIHWPTHPSQLLVLKGV